MSTLLPTATSSAPKSSSMIRTLTSVALICGILIVIVFQITFPIIKVNKRERLKKAVLEVIPQATGFETFVAQPDGGLAPGAMDDEKAEKFYAGYDAAGELVGVALEARGQGFQDILSIIYGYSPEKEAVVGMKVLDSKETPGLGDKIEKDPAFIANFEALDVRLNSEKSALEHPVTVVKHGKKENPWEIDAITGATISSKAVGKILQKSTNEKVPKIVKNLGRLKESKKESDGE